MKAFPVQDTSWYQGMDLRDYFAAKAMQSMADSITDSSRFIGKENLQRLAGVSYEIADAMMKAREQ